METKDIFEGMAARYDTPERAAMADIIAREMRAAISDNAAGGSAGAAMDYGCGTGLVGLRLLDDFESMLFVDNSPNMIKLVQHKIDEAGINKQRQKARAICADLTQAAPQPLEQQLSQVDYILVSQVLLHIRDVPQLLGRLCGLLKEGGHLLAVDFDHNPQVRHELVHSGFHQAELIQAAQQAGFRSAQAHTFHHGQAIFMKKDASLFIMDAVK